MKKLFYTFFILLLITSLQAGEKKTLQAGDVKLVMQEIMKQNGIEKDLNEKIIRNSFRIYIEQFDPTRMYLLESEVSPYLNPSKEKIQNVMRGWKNTEFKEYEQLNVVIEKAILRAQRERSSFDKTIGTLEKELTDVSEETGAEPGYAKDLSDLQQRQKTHFLQFINQRKNGNGPTQLGLFTKNYEESVRGHENEYPNPRQDKDSLFYMHVLKGLTKGLDAHTSYLNNQDAFDMKFRLEKSMDGIGIIVGKEEQGFIVSKIMEGSPAFENGKIKENDLIVKIDGESIAEKNLTEVVGKLRGKAGTEVEITFKHTGKPPENVRLVRKTMTVNEGRVTYRYVPFDGGIIGVIKLKSFYQNDAGISAEGDVRRAIEELSSKGRLKGLVLDLRENSGGFLSQAVKVAGLFITNGIVVISKYANGQEQFYRDMDGKVYYDGPLVVLTSKITASAAEIVAQALQDYGVALVVGDERTYGKGTVQSQTVTEGDASSYFKVTVGKYYTASGKTPQEKWVRADIIVPSILDGELIGEEYLELHLKNDRINPAFQDSLQDLESALKPWYLRYYIPTLQKRSSQWKDAIAGLAQKSQQRLSNEDYTNKIKGENFGYDQKNDLQLFEGVNIIKDMILHEAKDPLHK